jgi:hypothetical protein
MVLDNLKYNSQTAKKLLAKIIPLVAKYKKKCRCNTCMKGAIITDRKLIPQKTRTKLKAILKNM